VTVHQLITLDDRKEANERTIAGEGVGTEGIVEGFKCFPAKPRRIGKAMTLGTQA